MTDLTKFKPEPLEVPESDTPKADDIKKMFEKAIAKQKKRTSATKPKFRKEKVRAKNKAAKKARRK